MVVLDFLHPAKIAAAAPLMAGGQVFLYDRDSGNDGAKHNCIQSRAGVSQFALAYTDQEA